MVFTEVVIYYFRVIDLRMTDSACHGNGIKNCGVAGKPIPEKVSFSGRRCEELIIVEVYKLFG